MEDQQQTPTDWWRRPAGIREVLRTALPLAVSTGCVSVALFADRLCLRYHDQAEMAASLPAGNLFWTLICLPVGMAGMTSAFVSQYLGIGRPRKVGALIFQAVWLSLIGAAAIMLLGPLAEGIFIATGQAEELIPYESLYFRLLLWGSGGAFLEASLSGFFSGTQRAGTVLMVNLIATVANIVLDVLLIFGWGWIPELGIAGAAYATTASFWLKALIYLALMTRSADRRTYGLLEGVTVQPRLALRFVIFSFPAGLQYLLESASFMVILIQLGQMGSDVLAASTMALNFNMVAFVPLIGVAIAASVLVGHHLTTHGPRLAMRAAYSSLLVGMAYAAFCAVLYVAFPDFILRIYALGETADATQNTLPLTKILLRFVAAYCVLDAVQVVLSGALRGAGDTWYVLVMAVGCAVLMIGGGWWFESWSPPDQRLYWWWGVLTAWVWALAIAFWWRLRRGGWTEKRLVETEPNVAMTK